MNVLEELMTSTAALDGAAVEYALVGGLAVAVWGAPRATKDIDLLVRREQLEDAMNAVATRGFTLAAAPLRFRDGMDLQRVSKVVAGAHMTIDFILVNEVLEPIWTSRRRIATADGPLWVVSRDALIAMKAQAARPQDIADIERLRESDR
jgi:hypothetical protein